MIAIARYGFVLLAMWPIGATCAWSREDSADSPSELQEVVVTAQRSSSGLQTTPLAVTALSGPALKALNVTDLDSLALAVPGVSFGDELGEAHIAIRGIGSDSVNPGVDPRIAYYQDGIYFGRPTAQLGGMFDLERVEVLKGPQGTLYGRNATGGAISVISRGPAAQASGYADVSYGNYNTIDFDGAIGGPIADSVAGRIAMQTKFHDGYGTNITTGSDIDNQTEGSVRASLRWDPSASLSFLTIADYHKENDRSGGLHFFGSDNPAVPIAGISLGGVVPSDSRDIASARDPFTRVQTYGITEIVTASFDWATMKSYTSLRHSDATFGTNPTGTSLPITYGTSIENAHQVSEELQLSGDHGRLHWLGGALFFYEHVDDSIAFPFNLLLFGGPNQIQQGYLVSGQQSDKSAAPYVRLTYDITDEVSLILGARYSFEEKIIDQTSQFDLTRPYSPSNPVIPSPGFPNVESKDYHQTTPTATLDYKLTPDVFLFATYAEGFKSGGFNPGILQPPYQPETIKEYELGLKSKELNGRMKINVDVFYYNYSNLQVTIIRGTNADIENAATAGLYGTDIDLEVLPISTLRIDGSIEFLHSEYKNYFSANPAFPGEAAKSLSGNQLTQAPKYSGRLGAEYSWSLGAGNLSVRGDYAYQSRTYFTPFNEPAVSQAGHSLTNASVNYTASGGGWHTGLYVNNLSNSKAVAQDYVASELFGGPVIGVLTPPRTYGVRFGFAF
jgi:iron complex outermembrane receptor protein